MGNKQKSQYDSIFLLCSSCFKKVPKMNIFILDNKPMIKISCNCQALRNHSDILPLSGYIHKMLNRDPLLLKCSNHQNDDGIDSAHIPELFCFHCEKWLCSSCIKKKHSEAQCNKERQARQLNCPKHQNMNITHICKFCKDFLCKTCLRNHSTTLAPFKEKNKEYFDKHKIIEIEGYITEGKIAQKLTRMSIWKTNITQDNKKFFDEINEKLLCDDALNNEESNEYQMKTKLETAYRKNKEVNESLALFFEILFTNLKVQKHEHILNENVVYNIIANTSFTKQTNYTLNTTLSLHEQVSHLENYYLRTFINTKLQYDLIKLNQEEAYIEPVSVIMRLPGNKFLTAGDTSIHIYSGDDYQKLFTLTGHTNTIQSICSIKENIFASSSSDKTIRVWDINKQECIKIIPVVGMANLLFANIDNADEIACINYGKKVEVYSIELGKVKNEIVFQNSCWANICYTLSNGKIILGKEDSIVILKRGSFEIENEIENLGDELKVLLEMKNKNVLFGYKSKGIGVYNMNFERSCYLEGHKAEISGLVQLKNELVLSGSKDSKFILWNVETRECLEMFYMNKMEINYMLVMNDNEEIENEKENDNEVIVCVSGEKLLDVWKFKKYEEE